MTLRLATRRSPLATHQATTVQRRLAAAGVDSELVFVDTAGDRDRTTSLTVLGGVGVFAVEVQRRVLEGVADVAVHSAKDLPSLSPEGLALVAVPERRDPADALVGRSLAGLGPGATVATGSPRRRALLLERRPDLNVVELRGNMATRLARAGRDGVDAVDAVDAVVAACAALERLDVADRCAERLDPDWFVPQVGQGAIALEARADDSVTAQLLSVLDDVDAARSLAAERAFLRELGAGCQVPSGAYAVIAAEGIELSGVMLAPDGTRSVRARRTGVDPERVGCELARHLRDECGGAALWTANVE